MDELNHSSSDEQVAVAIDRVAGMPHAVHEALLREIQAATRRSLGQLRTRLMWAIKKREVTEYPQLKLESFLRDQGVAGRQEAGGTVIADPLVEGDEIIVRDAVLLGHKPIVEKVKGYAHRTDDYVVALVGGAKIDNYMIPKQKVKELAENLCRCDAVKDIAPSLLATPNIAAFTKALRPGDFDNLLVTLRMNQRYAIVENDGQIVIFDNETRTSYKRDEFKAKMKPETDITKSKRDADAKQVSRFATWFDHPARAYFAGITLAPMDRDVHGRAKNVDKKYNLWTGFDQAGSPGDWSLLKDHIKLVICRGDEKCAEYVLNWMAHLFQKPWEKPGVAIVVWGQKRTGKGTVADAIREALGSHISRMFAQKDHVVGRFAGSARPLLFNQCEEAVFAKNPSEEGPLKSKITDPTENVELKFATPYEVPSFGRWWFNSNSETPVPITFDEERYVILQVSNTRASDHAYFAAIRNQLYHNGGLAAMVHELTHRDISKFNVRKPPHTEHRAKMVMDMLHGNETAVAEILIAGEIAGLDAKTGVSAIAEVLNHDAPTWIDKSKVRAVLNNAFKKHGMAEASASDITKKLYELGLIDTDRNAHRGRGHEAGYRFLPLRAARENFAKARGIDVSQLQGADVTRSSEEELRDLARAFHDFLLKFETREGEPKNFAAIKKAFMSVYQMIEASESKTNGTAENEKSRMY